MSTTHDAPEALDAETTPTENPARQLHLAVALDGAGWHPAAWREPTAQPELLFTADYWIDQARTAERGLLDFVTIEDSLGLQSTDPLGPDGRNDQVRGRLDAVLTAARIAPVTSHIGLVPTATVTHTEPFHVSKGIATLDYVSTGRAGWRAQLSASPAHAEHFGRRTIDGFDPADLASPEVLALIDDLFDEAADFAEVVRRLWDSWEDDAEIRDAATGRFVDRDKLHYIDFASRHFSVRGPSIVPRPPQGQPLVTALAHVTSAYRFAARSADVIFVTPFDTTQVGSILDEVRSEITAAGRKTSQVRIFADLVVFLDSDAATATERKARLDALDGTEYRSDALIFTGSAAELADLLAAWQAAGLDGFRLRPGAVPHDLDAITDDLVPELQRRGLFRENYLADTLRGHLGLPRPQNRYAATSSTTTAALEATTAQGVSA
ncbi:LLM class flavin-dependent oxidoreductase [Nakamurella silvestris]|nr:LLM class flavin-dependent oxidoreductase [Nakamurella silvestris]